MLGPLNEAATEALVGVREPGLARRRTSTQGLTWAFDQDDRPEAHGAGKPVSGL